MEHFLLILINILDFYDTARALNVENYSFGNYNFGWSVCDNSTFMILGLGTHSLQFSKFGYTQVKFSNSISTPQVL